MRIPFIIGFILIICCSCTVKSQDNTIDLICDTCLTVATRFNVPRGFERIKVEKGSFGDYLRNLPVKHIDSEVAYFDGTKKSKTGVYVSVIDHDIDAQDLEQCADAIMRLKGEYHFQRKEYDKIHFNFIADGKPRFYKNYVKGDYSYKMFRKYMRYVFSYANTASLYHEMKKVPVDSMKIGDVFIQKGNPYGHAVIVVDMAINESTGEKIFMLAQSYMPAQETQILANPNNSKLSPWYELKAGDFRTPEWTFTSEDLRTNYGI